MSTNKKSVRLTEELVERAAKKIMTEERYQHLKDEMQVESPQAPPPASDGKYQELRKRLMALIKTGGSIDDIQVVIAKGV